MDCCNYVEAYTPGAHFYQQQHHHQQQQEQHQQHQQQQQHHQQQQAYFYNNSSVAPYVNYGTTPISNMLEANARHNAVLPAAYHPTGRCLFNENSREPLKEYMRFQSTLFFLCFSSRLSPFKLKGFSLNRNERTSIITECFGLP